MEIIWCNLQFTFLSLFQDCDLVISDIWRFLTFMTFWAFKSCWMYGLDARWAVPDISSNRRAATHQETQNYIQEGLNFQFSHLYSAEWKIFLYLDVLLTVRLSIILVINQLSVLFYNKFIICLYMFRALCAHHQEVKIILYKIWYHHTCRWPSRARVGRGLFSQPLHRTATYRCDDARCCIIQFRPPVDEHIVLETCRGV